MSCWEGLREWRGACEYEEGEARVLGRRVDVNREVRDEYELKLE